MSLEVSRRRFLAGAVAFAGAVMTASWFPMSRAFAGTGGSYGYGSLCKSVDPELGQPSKPFTMSYCSTSNVHVGCHICGSVGNPTCYAAILPEPGCSWEGAGVSDVCWADCSDQGNGHDFIAAAYCLACWFNQGYCCCEWDCEPGGSGK